MVRRKYLAVDEQVAEEVFRAARSKGMTLFSYTTELLRESLDIERSYMRLKEAKECLEAFLLAKELGFTLVPEYLVARLVNKASPQEVRKLSEEVGNICGRYFMLKRGASDPIQLLEEAAKKLLWGVTELVVKEGDNEFSVTCILSLRERNYAEAIAGFITGFLRAFAYRPVRLDVSKGMATVLFEQAV